MDEVNDGAAAGRTRQAVVVWLLWTLANIVAMTAGGAAIDALGLVGAVLFGAFAGGAQWLALRRYRLVTRWWVAATAAGNLLGWFLSLVPGFVTAYLLIRSGVAGFGSIFFVVVVGAVGGVVGGASVGVFQYMVLERRVRSPGWWPVACLAGGAAAGGISGWDLIVRMIVITGEMQYTFTRGTPFTVGPDRTTRLIFANGAISGALCGAAYGAITGIALAILVRQPRSAAQL